MEDQIQNYSNKMNLSTVSTTTGSSIGSDVQIPVEPSSGLASGNESEAVAGGDSKERLQRFDLVIQHLHRLRATLALDSSVRELQKLQTLTLLGQNLGQAFSPKVHLG